MYLIECYFKIYTTEKVKDVAMKISSILFGGAEFYYTDRYECEGYELKGSFLGCKVAITESIEGVHSMEIRAPYSADGENILYPEQDSLVAHMQSLLVNSGVKADGFSVKKNTLTLQEILAKNQGKSK